MNRKTLVLLSMCGALLSPLRGQKQQSPPWVATFEASPATYAGLPVPKEAQGVPAAVTGTLRYRFGISVGGSRMLVRLSNELGTQPLRIAGASIALAGDEMNAVPGTLRRLTFGGKDSVEIAPGSPVLSDPVELPVPAMADLLASVYLREPLELAPLGGASMVLTAGDDLLTAAPGSQRRVVSRPLVTSVLVAPARPARVVVALGDSITDGVRTAPAEPHGWVATLAARLAAQNTAGATAVVTAGISGNQLLKTMMGPAALARLDRDVFSVPGVTDVVLLEGINDIGFSGKTPFSVSPELAPETLIAGYRQIAAQCHSRGLRLFVGTLLPAEGAFYFSEAKEKTRQAVNSWIRHSPEIDGAIDFDATMRDPSHPSRLQPKYDSGDISTRIPTATAPWARASTCPCSANHCARQPRATML